MGEPRHGVEAGPALGEGVRLSGVDPLLRLPQSCAQGDTRRQVHAGTEHTNGCPFGCAATAAPSDFTQ